MRAKLLFACLVTPALWLNLSDFRNILIIHFGLLLKERTLDSIVHDLWKKYNAICLLYLHSGFLLMHSGVLIHPSVAMVWIQ